MEVIQGIDNAVLLFVTDHVRCSILNVIMVFFTTIANAGAVWLVLGAAMLIWKKYRLRGLTVLICIAVYTVIGTLILKNLIGRPRPFIAMPDLLVLVHKSSGFSFPSGHSGASFAAAYAIARGFGVHGAAPAYIAAAVIAMSRVYVGVHYPSDIIAGAVIGTISAAFAYAITTRIAERVKAKDTI